MIEKLLNIDRAMLLWFRDRRRPLTTRVFRTLTFVGNGSTLTVMGLILLAIPYRMTHAIALRLLLGAGGAACASQAFKRVLKRPRPSVSIVGFQALARNPDAFSFPSGHAAAMTALAFSCTGLWPALAVALMIVAAGVAVSRVYLGAHYPLDVLAGIALGCGVAAVLHALL
jgi:undecaprenyl-diphosphatase